MTFEQIFPDHCRPGWSYARLLQGFHRSVVDLPAHRLPVAGPTTHLPAAPLSTFLLPAFVPHQLGLPLLDPNYLPAESVLRDLPPLDWAKPLGLAVPLGVLASNLRSLPKGGAAWR